MAARNTLNIMVVALLSVLVLVLIFLLVLQNQAIEEKTQAYTKMENQRKSADEAKKVAINETQELREVITGRRDELDVADIRKFAKDAFKFLDKLRGADGGAAGEEPEDNFQNLIRNFQLTVTRMEKAKSDALLSANKANLESQSREDTHRQDVTAKSKQITEREGEVSELQTKVETLTSSNADMDARYTEQITEKDDELTRITFDYERKNRLLAERASLLQGTINRLRMEQLPKRGKTEALPHGSMVQIANRHSAYVDLGRNDFVYPGLVFEVYEQIGKTRKIKGMVEINMAKADWSKVTILEEKNALDPIVKGDKIWSPFYKKDKKPIIAFVGEKLTTPLLSKEFLIQKLTARGAKVADDVDAGTDYVVAIQGYQDDPKYDKARLFGIMVLREDDILPYVVP